MGLTKGKDILFFDDGSYTKEEIDSLYNMVKFYVNQINEADEKLRSMAPARVNDEPFAQFLSRVYERTKIWKETELTKAILGGLIADNFSIVNFGVAHGDKAE